jgi:hypothetical protein
MLAGGLERSDRNEDEAGFALSRTASSAGDVSKEKNLWRVGAKRQK